uniref:Uncharacterized protein n=1 Tax=Trichuris muris TaxID=70415 RepID=A0A5S6Q792_TRIMR
MELALIGAARKAKSVRSSFRRPDIGWPVVGHFRCQLGLWTGSSGGGSSPWTFCRGEKADKDKLATPPDASPPPVERAALAPSLAPSGAFLPFCRSPLKWGIAFSILISRRPETRLAGRWERARAGRPP